MDYKRFEKLVFQALDELPEEFRNALENIDIVIADRPTREQMVELELDDDMDLLGLYEGIPLTERDTSYGLVPPDIITIFKKPIEANCRHDREIAREVRKVLLHEIAHYFGMDEEALEEIEGDD